MDFFYSIGDDLAQYWVYSSLEFKYIAVMVIFTITAILVSKFSDGVPWNNFDDGQSFGLGILLLCIFGALYFWIFGECDYESNKLLAVITAAVCTIDLLVILSRQFFYQIGLAGLGIYGITWAIKWFIDWY